MDIKIFEETMKRDIEKVFEDILKEFGYILDIRANARAGAEISDTLEDSFIEYFNKTKHPRIYNPESAPKEKTKNPWDIKFNYLYKDQQTGETVDELIWGDIKATKNTYNDSNPDLGTPTKIIRFMLEGHYYLLFILFEYVPTSDFKTQFVAFENGKYVKTVFLKDMNETLRINPKPQFQININEEPIYRNKAEFVEMFERKYNESLDRIIENVNRKRKQIKKQFSDIRDIHLKDDE